MSTIIEGKADFRALMKRIERLGREMENGMARAENRGLTTVKRVAKEEYDRGLGIKLSRDDADRRIILTEASSTRPGSVTVVTKRMSFASFQPKPATVRTDRGKRIGVTIKTSSGRQLVDGFLIPGKRPVFERRGPERGPLDVRFTTAPSRIFSSSDVLQRIRREGMESFAKNVVSEYKFRRQKVFGAQ